MVKLSFFVRLEAKPGKEVRPGQRLILDLASKKMELEILKLPAKNLKKEEAKELYQVMKEEIKKENFFE